MLLENLKKGILQVLDDPKYDFELVTEIGQTKPSNREIIDVLMGMLDDEISVSPSVSDVLLVSFVEAWSLPAFSLHGGRAVEVGVNLSRFLSPRLHVSSVALRLLTFQPVEELCCQRSRVCQLEDEAVSGGLVQS